MREFARRMFRLEPGEERIVFILSILFLGNETARQTSAIVGISDFIDTGGVNGLLLVWVLDAIVIILTAALSSLIVDRFKRLHLLRWTAFAFMVVFLVLRLLSGINLPASVLSAVLFLMSQQQWLVFPLFFWVFANDLFNMAQTKRLFPLIGSWSFIGKMLGIGIALLPGLLFSMGLMSTGEMTINMVLTFDIVVYLLIFLLAALGLRDVKLRRPGRRGETVRETLTEGWGFMQDVLSFRFLAIVVVIMAVCTMVIEFRFLDVSKTAISDIEDYKMFYSMYRLITALLSFVVQGFLTSRIINKLQLKYTFLILPFAMVGSLIALIVPSGVVGATASQVISKMTRNTVDTSARKSFMALVPEERRGRVTLFIENYLPALGTILGCIITAAVVYIGVNIESTSYFYGYLVIAVILAGLATWIAFRMSAVYDSSLLNWRLKRRTRRSSMLDNIEF